MNAAVTDALRAVLPSGSSTTLMRACLHDGEPALRAWSEWRAAGRDLRTALRADPGIRPLGALLDHRLRANGAALEREELTVLRTAAVRAELRHATLLRVGAPALSALAEGSVDAVASGGAALAETVYPSASLRHCHDLDLLVPPDALQRASAVLARLGWRVFGARALHPSGAEVSLHTRLLPAPQYDLAPVESSPSNVGGAPVRALSPTDMLVLVCVRAVCRARPDALKWVADAWFTLASRIEWARVLSLARAGRLAIPLSVTLSYLAGELDAPVPRAALAELSALAEHEDRVAFDVALSFAFAAHRNAATRPSARTALLLARWALLPSPAYLRSTGKRLPLAYAARPIRAARRMAA